MHLWTVFSTDPSIEALLWLDFYPWKCSLYNLRANLRAHIQRVKNGTGFSWISSLTATVQAAGVVQQKTAAQSHLTVWWWSALLSIRCLLENLDSLSLSPADSVSAQPQLAVMGLLLLHFLNYLSHTWQITMRLPWIHRWLLTTTAVWNGRITDYQYEVLLALSFASPKMGPR